MILSHHQLIPWTMFSLLSFVKTKIFQRESLLFKHFYFPFVHLSLFQPLLGVELNYWNKTDKLAAFIPQQSLTWQWERTPQWAKGRMLCSFPGSHPHAMGPLTLSQQHKASPLLWTFGCLIIVGNTNVKGNTLKKSETFFCVFFYKCFQFQLKVTVMKIVYIIYLWKYLKMR